MILQRLAIGEAPLTPPHEPQDSDAGRPRETLAAITMTASACAAQRAMPAIGTLDILVAVMRHYPEAFERALNSRGSDHWELVEGLASSLHAPLRELQTG